MAVAASVRGGALDCPGRWPAAGSEPAGAAAEITASAVHAVVGWPAPGTAEASLRKVVAVQEAERRRISRDLHDIVGQALTAVRLDLETLGREPHRMLTGQRLARSIAIVDEALASVRGVALELRPQILDDLGLVPAVRWYVRRQARAAGYRATVVAHELRGRVSEDVEIATFRVLQEALTNVARHSRAANVRVQVTRTADAITLVVEDDGVGFDMLSMRRRAEHHGGLGLRGMAERTSLAGGSLEIVAAVGRGVRICARFPHPSPVPGPTTAP